MGEMREWSKCYEDFRGSGGLPEMATARDLGRPVIFIN